eukprot:gene9703-13060_t
MNTLFSRIDIVGAEDSVESRSAQLLEAYHNGLISIADLMGPIHGISNLSPNLSIPTGMKEKPSSAPSVDFLPKDEHNNLLEHHVHPADYTNPTTGDEDYDLVAVGAGVSGLISVIIGAWLGKKCALIERHAMGGDCLNTGCVPSKALIACAKAAHSTKHLASFGIHIPDGAVTVDFNFIMSRMREIRAKISHHDSVQRYSKEFCKHVFVGNAKFIDNNTIEVIGDDNTPRILKFKKAMIATGASAAIPPIPGLQDLPHLTNSNFFNQTSLPPSMVVIGCGPIGLELAQSMSRFGSKVFCLEQGSRFLPREDPEAAEILRNQLIEDGVEIFFNVRILSVEAVESNEVFDSLLVNKLYKISIVDGEGIQRVLISHALLNATGRVPNVHDLGLENVGVEWDNRKGVYVDEYFCTANPNIYACGDCTSPFKFTHSADFQARVAIRNMFLGEMTKSSDLLIPWCTYTEPEIAHVGKYESELDASGIGYELLTRQLKDVDRCMCDGVTSGFVKIIVKAGTSQIIGATICGPNAGDMISELTLSIQYGITVPQIAGTIHPYPTTQESIRQACLGFNKYFKNPAGVPLATLKLIMDEREKNETKKI